MGARAYGDRDVDALADDPTPRCGFGTDLDLSVMVPAAVAPGRRLVVRSAIEETVAGWLKYGTGPG